MINIDEYFLRHVSGRTDFTVEENYFSLLRIMTKLTNSHPYIYDLKTDVLYGSPELYELYGISVGTTGVPYKNWEENMVLISDESALKKEKMIILNQKVKRTFTVDIIKQDTGEIMRLLCTAIPVVDENNEVVLVYGTDQLLDKYSD